MIYMYDCVVCDAQVDAYRKVDERDDAPLCCGKPMARAITVPFLMIRPEIRYTSPIDDRPITSMSARREDLARNNCRPYDPGMKEDADRRAKESEEALDKAVDETVDREISAMPVRKRETLEIELINATVETVRLTGATHG